MAEEVIKKIKITQDNLPTINSITEKYDIRYRVISEDKTELLIGPQS